MADESLVGAPSWFRNLIRDKVNIQYQSRGDYLANTMQEGDEQAGIVRFPVFGRLEATELTGGIESIEPSDGDMQVVEVKPRDFEAASYVNTKDGYKMGPNQQDAIAKGISMAIRRTADKIRMNALRLFCNGDPDAGGENEIIDTPLLTSAAVQLFGQDMVDDDDVFCFMPSTAFGQLLFSPEFSKASFTGGNDLPFSQSMRKTAKTLQGVHYFSGPFEYWFNPKAEWPAYIDIFMWARNAMGAHTPWKQDAPEFFRDFTKKGNPILAKTGMGGAAIGIFRDGVKKIRIKNNKQLIRPALPRIVQNALSA